MSLITKPAALRIALAAKALPEVEMSGLVAKLGSQLGIPITEEKLATVTVADLKLMLSGEETVEPDVDNASIKLAVRHLNFYYGDKQALFDNNLDIAANRVTAFIGPSGCGKSTHIRTYNRMFSLYKGFRAEGEIMMDGTNILDPKVPALKLRHQVGMIFQKPTPFPMSVFDNIAYGLKLHSKISASEIKGRVEKSLRFYSVLPSIRQSLMQ